MKNVTADRSLYAAFTATVRKYTVRFYNGSTLLQTVNNVPYGGSATYTGDEPADESGNPFQGWKPEPTSIMGDTDCYAVFMKSEDVGKVWTQSNITSDKFWATTYADGIWVVCSNANGGLYYSADGQNWTQSNITSGSFREVTYADDIWVVCSNSGGLYYSADGQNWTQSNITSGSFRTAAYADGIWVVCSNDGAGLYYSK